MAAYGTVETEKPSVPLEAIEFELALNAESLRESGFEGSIRNALARSSGTLLFQMPTTADTDCQRVAAILVGQGAESRILMVLLTNDGDSFRIESPDQSTLAPFARMASSFRDVLERLATPDEVVAH